MNLENRIDTGQDTLEAIAEAGKFNKWMFETIRPFIKGEVLEIGSGIGNISEFILKTSATVTLSDFNESYCDRLRNKFFGQKNLVDILSIDLVDEKFDEQFAHLFGLYDTVITLNVIEHIENDDLAINNCKKLLNQQGQLIILVPAYQVLYNNFDKELGHYRRYTKENLKHRVSKHLQIIHCQYFNLAGILGWFFSGSILKKKIISASQMNLYNKLVPFFRVADRLVRTQAGLSVIVVGKKS